MRRSSRHSRTTVLRCAAPSPRGSVSTEVISSSYSRSTAAVIRATIAARPAASAGAPGPPGAPPAGAAPPSAVPPPPPPGRAAAGGGGPPAVVAPLSGDPLQRPRGGGVGGQGDHATGARDASEALELAPPRRPRCRGPPRQPIGQ